MSWDISSRLMFISSWGSSTIGSSTWVGSSITGSWGSRDIGSSTGAGFVCSTTSCTCSTGFCTGWGEGRGTG